MTYQSKTEAVKIWGQWIDGLRAEGDEYSVRVADVIERAIAAACANAKCTVDMLPFVLPGQRLTIDLPTA